MKAPLGKSVHPLFILCLTILVFSLACVRSSSYCPSRAYIDISGAETFEKDAGLPFRFPLNNITQLQSGTIFAASSYFHSTNSKEYHAAEDYPQVPGIPVFAMADGIVSFSGPMGGYGWLVIIDHPDMNLYSLYGHLSPSRWHTEPSVSVVKGQLIGHLGDADENGDFTPHLHFGIRAGQRADYPSMGEWRWQAGWIKYCPQELGWLQPSLIIMNQDIPSGGFSGPKAGFLEIWWLEFILSAAIFLGFLVSFIYVTRRFKPLPLLIYSALLALAAWFVFNQGLRINYALLTLGVLLILMVGLKIIRRFKPS